MHKRKKKTTSNYRYRIYSNKRLPLLSAAFETKKNVDERRGPVNYNQNRKTLILLVLYGK